MPYKCKKCGDVVDDFTNGRMTPCKCGAIFIDGTKDYTRVNGYPEDYEYIDKESMKLYEMNLPPYLKNDIDALIRETKKGNMNIDLYFDEVYGSINSALYSYEITKEQADFLRDKYCYGKYEW